MAEETLLENPLGSQRRVEEHPGGEESATNQLFSPPEVEEDVRRPLRPSELEIEPKYPTVEEFEIITRANIKKVVRGDHLAYSTTFLGGLK